MSSTASVGGSNSAYAYSTSRGIERLISRADRNADGQISQSEFGSFGQNLPGNSATSSTSGAATTDASGSATASTASSASARNALFSQIDTSGDGQISADELSAFKQQQVSTMQSALLNLQEVFGGGGGTSGGQGGVEHAHRGHRHHAGQAPTTAASGTAGQGDASSASSGTATDPVSAFFSAVDTNSDGSINRAELSSFVTQMFSRVGASAQAGTSTASGASTAATGTTV